MDKTVGMGSMGGAGMSQAEAMVKEEKMRADKEMMKSVIDNMDEQQMTGMMGMMKEMGMMGGNEEAPGEAIPESNDLDWNEESVSAGKKLANMGLM